MNGSVPYRDFYYPLNVFMHILTHEEGDVAYLHYGLFEHAGESIAAAQERSTELLLSHLPPPPARLLDVGVGLGTTLARLAGMGYDAEGITPDQRQIDTLRARQGDALRVSCSTFESFQSDRPFDAIVFQESSQYIDAEALFVRAGHLAPRVIVLDEFALQPVDTLHPLPDFLQAAARHGFLKQEDIDVSPQAAPTIDYFMSRLERYRPALVADLGLTDRQIDELISSGEHYRELYRSGAYVYRLMTFAR
jgi:hypothetical protein